MLLLLISHSAIGVLTLTGSIPGGTAASKAVSHSFLTVLCVHAAISVVLTVKSMITIRRSGTSYPKENRLFWIRRISGFAIMLFAFQHFWMFSPTFTSEGMLPPDFGVLDLVVSILLAVSVVIHISSNIRPLSVSLGVRTSRLLLSIVVVLFIIGLFCVCHAFFYYYSNWSTLWGM
ncbi:MAG: hypothetical protein IJ863_06935 [Spirochaetales bacterium]|nr:hypothetical protein [Spirochaetales bacterium]